MSSASRSQLPDGISDTPQASPQARFPDLYELTPIYERISVYIFTMEPFSAAVGGAQALEGCLKTYQFITTAMNMGSDGYRLVSQLDWEHFRLQQWREYSGLSRNEPSVRLNWGYATALLVEQKALLTTADKLADTYKLNISEDEISTQLEGSETDSGDEFSRWLRRLRPELRSQAIQRKNSTIRKLRWAGAGRKEVTRIVADLRNVNDRLYFLLDSADRDRNQHVQDHLLREIISRCESPNGIDSVQSVINHQEDSSQRFLAAAAALRQVLLVISHSRPHGRTSRADVVSSCQPLRQFNYARLKGSSSGPSKGVQIAQYDGKDVVVEWRVVDKPRWDQFEKAMQRLAFLLTAIDKNTFHTLSCLGLVASQEAGHIGFVYQVPSCGPETSIRWQHTSLYDMLSHGESVSLSRRLDIASEMAETLLQIHTAGWLHKGLRSENIIFLSSPAADNSEIVSSKAFLLGFEYSRPDSRSGALLTEPPKGSVLTDLYRHPAARGLNREAYCKQFDMYSLGCLLLELALWKRLIDIVPVSHSHEAALSGSPSGVSSDLKADMPSFLDFGSLDAIKQRISYHAGDLFCCAVTLCFTSSQNSNYDNLNVQHQVLETLRSCRQRR
ncbi:prion-inhibition and propagation-domain-containing protein [Aspergillus aurantiobrunneus]